MNYTSKQKNNNNIRAMILFTLVALLLWFIYSNYVDAMRSDSAIKLNSVLGNPISDTLITHNSEIGSSRVMELASKKIQDLEYSTIFFKEFPLPLLIKEKKDSCNCFITVAFNTAFEKMFLIPNNITRTDYIGSSDYEYWPINYADEYKRQDFEALKNGIIEFDTEFKINNETESGHFTKWSDRDKFVYMYCYKNIR